MRAGTRPCALGRVRARLANDVAPQIQVGQSRHVPPDRVDVLQLAQQVVREVERDETVQPVEAADALQHIEAQVEMFELVQRAEALDPVNLVRREHERLEVRTRGDLLYFANAVAVQVEVRDVGERLRAGVRRRERCALRDVDELGPLRQPARHALGLRVQVAVVALVREAARVHLAQEVDEREEERRVVEQLLVRQLLLAADAAELDDLLLEGADARRVVVVVGEVLERHDVLRQQQRVVEHEPPLVLRVRSARDVHAVVVGEVGRVHVLVLALDDLAMVPEERLGDDELSVAERQRPAEREAVPRRAPRMNALDAVAVGGVHAASEPHRAVEAVPPVLVGRAEALLGDAQELVAAPRLGCEQRRLAVKEVLERALRAFGRVILAVLLVHEVLHVLVEPAAQVAVVHPDHAVHANARDPEPLEVVREEARVDELGARSEPQVGRLALLEAHVAARIELDHHARRAENGDLEDALAKDLEQLLDRRDVALQRFDRCQQRARVAREEVGRGRLVVAAARGRGLLVLPRLASLGLGVTQLAALHVLLQPQQRADAVVEALHLGLMHLLRLGDDVGRVALERLHPHVVVHLLLQVDGPREALRVVADVLHVERRELGQVVRHVGLVVAELADGVVAKVRVAEREALERAQPREVEDVAKRADAVVREVELLEALIVHQRRPDLGDAVPAKPENAQVRQRLEPVGAADAVVVQPQQLEAGERRQALDGRQLVRAEVQVLQVRAAG